MAGTIATRGLGRSDLALSTLGVGRFSVTGRVKVFIGEWIPKYVKVSNGVSWVVRKAHVWNGSFWEATIE